MEQFKQDDNDIKQDSEVISISKEMYQQNSDHKQNPQDQKILNHPDKKKKKYDRKRAQQFKQIQYSNDLPQERDKISREERKNLQMIDIFLKQERQLKDKEKCRKKNKYTNEEYSESGQSNSPLKQPTSPIQQEEISELKTKKSDENSEQPQIQSIQFQQQQPILKQVSSQSNQSFPECKEKIFNNEHTVINPNLSEEVQKCFFLNMFDYQYEEKQKLEQYSQEKQKLKQTKIPSEDNIPLKINPVNKELFNQTIIVQQNIQKKLLENKNSSSQFFSQILNDFSKKYIQQEYIQQILQPYKQQREISNGITKEIDLSLIHI
eukprot:TRINITY_DN36520_c0_g1_i1.p1 TRINITY_DN36520_c0_g1~~TRINITY_DN36520_c0_g1_i1.p1  ORF type:complete len:321 (-),score=67.21 TRINITY_DN36520_c0_g1_i1:165-1127(-)